ncbi:MAG: thymidine phosphorylase [Acidobacteria bacterium]|nr:thymidine phosphorylase [Acidobacteriota bacterium]
MRMTEIITQKRDGGELSPEEIGFFLQGIVKGEVPDFQASALLMAIYFNGLSDQEQYEWSNELLKLAVPMDLSDIPGVKISKHSTGGVGDKVSLIVGPLVAAAGISVPMIIGRGLAHTGGTLDKMESIAGFKTSLTAVEFKAALRKVNIAMMAPVEGLLPADKKLYALRNGSGSSECIPMIAGSILARKLAEGTDGLVLDVKVGSGALTKKMTDARRLAQIMVTVGKRMGRKVVALITEMDQPLGYAVGHALEVMEAIETLRGNGPDDLVQISLEIASRMVCLAHPDRSLDSAKEEIFQLLNDGKGLQKFRELIEAQGGNPQVIDSFELLPNASAEHVISSPRAGFVSRISADDIGRAVALIGRKTGVSDEALDAAVGIVLEHKVGDRINAGDRLCTIYYNDDSNLEEATATVEDAFRISTTAPDTRPLVYEVMQ